MSPSATTRPLQVYLDSSDFSLLSDPTKNSPHLSRIEKRLIEYRDRGIIQIRFSYAHIIEVAPITTSHLAFAKARFACIARLCQQKTFVAPSTLIEDEVRRICSGNCMQSDDSVFRENGNWTPTLSNEDMDFYDPAAEIRRRLEGAQLGRSARRKLERHYFAPDGQLRPAALSLLQESLPSALQEIQSKYPLSSDALETVRHYFTGRADSAAMTAAVMHSFSDLDKLAEWFELHWETVTPTTNWLRASGENLKNSLLETIAKVGRMCAETNRSVLSVDEILSIGRQSFEEMHSRLFANVVLGVANQIGVTPPCSLPDEPWRIAPSLFTAVEAMVAVGKASALAFKDPRSPKRSDLGDVLHCLYLPFVDIFRTDAFMANAIRSAKIPTVKTICANLRDLIDHIDALCHPVVRS